MLEIIIIIFFTCTTNFIIQICVLSIYSNDNTNNPRFNKLRSLTQNTSSFNQNFQLFLRNLNRNKDQFTKPRTEEL